MGNLLRRQVLIPEDLWEKVQNEARFSRLSASAVVRQALKKYLNRKRVSPRPIPSFALGAPDNLEREDYYDGRC